jgi:hypothetical protein
MTSPKVADINGDGRADLVTAELSPTSNYAWNVKVHLQQPNGTFAAGYVVGLPVDLNNPLPKVTVVDVDGNGRPDIIAFTRKGFWVARQSSTGSFGSAVSYSESPPMGHEDMAVGDVNGDGRPDVITERPAEAPDGYLNVFYGQRGGVFAPPKLIPAEQEPSSVVAADITGDGRSDILVSQGGYPQIGVLAQRSDGTLSPISLTRVAGAPTCERCMAVGDLNGDHLMDVAIVLHGWSDSPIQLLYQRP